jgi:hypothetical protein
MRLDPFNRRRVDILISQAVGIGGESVRKRADGLFRRSLFRMVLRDRHPRGGGECCSACCQT